MKLSVEFPSVAYREGPAKVVELAQAIEAAGYDDLAMFDHVVMGYATAARKAPMYPSQMPILEAFVTLAYVAAVTSGSPCPPRCSCSRSARRHWWPSR